MIQCLASGVRFVVIKTVDTDVLILAIAYRHYAQHFDSEVNIILGSRSSITMSMQYQYFLVKKFVSHCHSFTHFLVAIVCHHFSTTANVNCGIDGKNFLTKMHLLKPFPSWAACHNMFLQTILQYWKSIYFLCTMIEFVCHLTSIFKECLISNILYITI